MENIMSADELVLAFRQYGVSLFVGDDGVVHGRMSGGKKMPMEAYKLVDQLRLMNDAVVRYLASENTQEAVGITVEEALQYGERIKAGELQLVGNVIYHKATGLCDITVKGAAAV